MFLDVLSSMKMASLLKLLVFHMDIWKVYLNHDLNYFQKIFQNKLLPATPEIRYVFGLLSHTTSIYGDALNQPSSKDPWEIAGL